MIVHMGNSVCKPKQCSYNVIIYLHVQFPLWQTPFLDVLAGATNTLDLDRHKTQLQDLCGPLFFIIIIYFSTIRQSSSITFLLKLSIQLIKSLIKSLTGTICKGNKCRWQTKLFNIFILHTLESEKIKVMKNGKFPMNFLLDSLSSRM